MSWKQFIQIIFSTLQEDTLIIVHVQSMLTLKLIFLTMRRDFLSDFLFTALIAFDNKLTLIFLPKSIKSTNKVREREREMGVRGREKNEYVYIPLSVLDWSFSRAALASLCVLKVTEAVNSSLPEEREGIIGTITFNSHSPGTGYSSDSTLPILRQRTLNCLLVVSSDNCVINIVRPTS